MTTTPTYHITPALRFPDFLNDGDWEVKRFDESFSFLPNNTLSRAELNYEKGSTKNIHYGDVLIKFGERLDVKKEELPFITDEATANKFHKAKLQNGDVVIADTAEDDAVGKCTEIVGMTDETVVSGLHTIPIRPQVPFAESFLGYYLNSESYRSQLRPLMQGVKVTSLSKSAINKTTILCPKSVEEQKKIAQALTALDELIAATNEKLEQMKAYKKGLMQQLFANSTIRGGKSLNINHLQIPKLRFPEFYQEKEWEEKKLGEIFMRITDRNKENNQNVLTISAQYGLVSQYDYFNKNVASADVSNYYIINKGDFAYNKSRSQGHPYGAIKSLRLYDKGIVSPLYICFRTKSDDFDCDFLVYYFDTDLIDGEIGQIAQEGARNHGLLNISTTDFFDNVTIFVPSLPEQRKIALCLSSMDETINAYTEKADLLVQYKKGLMQQMFANTACRDAKFCVSTQTTPNDTDAKFCVSTQTTQNDTDAKFCVSTNGQTNVK